MPWIQETFRTISRKTGHTRFIYKGSLFAVMKFPSECIRYSPDFGDEISHLLSSFYPEQTPAGGRNPRKKESLPEYQEGTHHVLFGMKIRSPWRYMAWIIDRIHPVKESGLVSKCFLQVLDATGYLSRVFPGVLCRRLIPGW